MDEKGSDAIAVELMARRIVQEYFRDVQVRLYVLESGSYALELSEELGQRIGDVRVKEMAGKLTALSGVERVSIVVGTMPPD